MTKVNWSWICWPSATRKPIRVRRADHLPRRSPTKADQLSTINLWLAQEVCELFGKDGSDSSIVAQGNLSSSQIAFSGANGAGSSSDAIVRSIVSESTVLDKQVRAATRGKRANPTRMGNFARLTSCHTQIFAGHGSPGDIGRASASPAIDAMTIAKRRGRTLQHVSCPSANTSTSELHKIRLAHFNHESIRMKMNRLLLRRQ